MSRPALASLIFSSLVLSLSACAQGVADEPSLETASEALGHAPEGYDGASHQNLNPEMMEVLFRPAVEVFVDPGTYSAARASVMAFLPEHREDAPRFEIGVDSAEEAHDLAAGPIVIELAQLASWTGRVANETIEIPNDPAAIADHFEHGGRSLCDLRVLMAQATLHTARGPQLHYIGFLSPTFLEQLALFVAIARWQATRDEGCALPNGDCTQGNLCVFERNGNLNRNICGPVVAGCLCPDDENTVVVGPIENFR